MRVKFTTSMAGNRVAYNSGDTADVSDATAERLIAAGFAEPVEDPEDEPVEDPEDEPEPKKKRRHVKRARDTDQ